MVGRSRDGSTMAFPVVETLHQNSILLVTEAPAQVPPGTQRRAQQVAQQAVACLDGAQHGGNEREDICRTTIQRGCFLSKPLRFWRPFCLLCVAQFRRPASHWNMHPMHASANFVMEKHIPRGLLVVCSGFSELRFISSTCLSFRDGESWAVLVQVLPVRGPLLIAARRVTWQSCSTNMLCIVRRRAQCA